MKIENRQKILEETYNKTEYFSVKSMTYFEFLSSYVDGCLKADLADRGDITTKILHEELPATLSAQIVAKQDGVLSGQEEVEYIAKKAGLNLTWGQSTRAGGEFMLGEVLCTLKGSAYALLSAERTLLNLLQRMCGIATHAAEFNTEYTRVAVTRKTPLPFIDKRAAIDGGVFPHRVNLSDAIMIKDTHLDQFGRDFEVVGRLLRVANENNELRGVSFVEIEVGNQEEALHVAEMSRELDLDIPIVVMLDNFSPQEVKDALYALQAAALLSYVLIEVSGGITSENYKEYDVEDVDVMSIGAITHSVKAADISMKIA